MSSRLYVLVTTGRIMTTPKQTEALAIAHAASLKPMPEVAEMMDLDVDCIELYGRSKAKIKLEILEDLKERPNAKYVVVTAITPTPLGEGKTTTSIGLAQAMYQIG